MPKLKPTCPRKTKNSWNPWSQSGGWKGRRTMEERICGKDEFWAWSGREVVTVVMKEMTNWSMWDQIRVIGRLNLHEHWSEVKFLIVGKDANGDTGVRTPQGRSVVRPYFSWGTSPVSIDTARSRPNQSAFETGPMSWQVPTSRVRCTGSLCHYDRVSQ